MERSFGALSNVTVFWEVDPSSEEDLIQRTGNVTFGVGQTKADIVLQVAEDDIPELDKTFSVVLSGVSHGRLGDRTNATLTVLATDDPYGLFLFSERSRSVRVPEADADITLTIQREKGLMGSVRVTYGTLTDSDPPPFGTPGVGRASAGSDFIALMGSVTFVANQSEANITLRVLDDQDPERAESIFVELISVHLVKGVQDRPSKLESLNTSLSCSLSLLVSLSLSLFFYLPCFLSLPLPLTLSYSLSLSISLQMNLKQAL